MSKTQTNPLAPPSEPDREMLDDYTSSIQEGLAALYRDAHTHDVRTAAPADNEGAVGDILLIDDGTDKYLAIRYSDGWFKTRDLVAVEEVEI